MSLKFEMVIQQMPFTICSLIPTGPWVILTQLKIGDVWWCSWLTAHLSWTTHVQRNHVDECRRGRASWARTGWCMQEEAEEVVWLPLYLDFPPNVCPCTRSAERLSSYILLCSRHQMKLDLRRFFFLISIWIKESRCLLYIFSLRICLIDRHIFPR